MLGWGACVLSARADDYKMTMTRAMHGTGSDDDFVAVHRDSDRDVLSDSDYSKSGRVVI